MLIDFRSPVKQDKNEFRNKWDYKMSLMEKNHGKKCLTSFFRSDIELKNFNVIVFFLHKFRGRKGVKT